jgi:hypothetical protein
MLARIVEFISEKIKQYDQKRFDENFKFAQDIVDVERIIRSIERQRQGGLL